MSTPKKKVKRQIPPPNTFGYERPLSPSERIKQLEAHLTFAQERSEIENVATHVAELVNRIKEKRESIKQFELALSQSRQELSGFLLEHQLAVAKFKELGAVPQPTV